MSSYGAWKVVWYCPPQKAKPQLEHDQKKPGQVECGIMRFSKEKLPTWPGHRSCPIYEEFFCRIWQSPDLLDCVYGHGGYPN